MKTYKHIFLVLLLVVIFSIVDTKELISTLVQVDLFYLLILFLLSFVLIWLSCLKWQLFVCSGGHAVSVFKLMKFYTIGYFFNTFTPSYIGGDIARSFHLGQFLENQQAAFVSTFLERFTGLLAMSFLGLFFVLTGSGATEGVEISVILVAVATSILALVCFSQRVGNFVFSLCLQILKKLKNAKLSIFFEKQVERVDLAMAKVRKDPMLFIKAMFLSLLFHVATVVNTYIAAKAVGWDDPSFSGLFVVVPLVLLVSMVPLTPSGIGIQEGAFLFFLQRIGSTRAQALSIGIVLRAKVLVVAMVGWALFQFATGKKKNLNLAEAQN